MATFWGRRDGAHAAASVLVAGLLNILPALAAEVIDLRRRVADDEAIRNLPPPGDAWGASTRTAS